jgi:carbon starvation protein CstA
MTEHDDTQERAPWAIRYGLPVGGAAVLLGLAIAAAFGGTTDWGYAIPIGLVLGGTVLIAGRIALRRRGISVTRWIDDYWSREE